MAVTESAANRPNVDFCPMHPSAPDTRKIWLATRIGRAMGAVAFGVVLAAAPAAAQQFPGFAVAQQPPAVAAPPPAAAQVTPKPKPKPKAVAVAKPADPAPPGDAVTTGGAGRIVMLVNDDPITAREIDQRVRFLAASGNVGPQAQEIFKRLATSEATSTRFRAMAEAIIRENQGKIPDQQIMGLIEKRKVEFSQSLQRQAMDQARSSVSPKLRKDAIEELIEEKLKLQEAKAAKVEISSAEVDQIIAGIAERNKQTPLQFAQNMKAAGVDIATMRARFKAGFAWRDTVRRTYGGQIQIIEPEIARFISAQASGKGQVDSQELEVQRIVFALPGKLDQSAMARALADADAMRLKISGCKSMEALTKDQASVRFEAAKYVKPSAITEPTRSMLLGAKDGEVLPPQTAPDGVELMALCARRALAIDDTQREAATRELQSRQFEELANQRLKELRRDARIDTRE